MPSISTGYGLGQLITNALTNSAATADSVNQISGNLNSSQSPQT